MKPDAMITESAPAPASACRYQARGAGGRSEAETPSRVSLAWVETSHGMRHVSAFAHLSPRERPRNTKGDPRAVRCPVCQQPVVIRIPKVRAFHAAHQPGATCP